MAQATGAELGPGIRVLITGSTGYIGGKLASELIGAGCRVVAVVRSVEKAHELSRRLPAIGIVQSRQPDGLAEAVADARPDIVFHLAALRVPIARRDDVDATIGSNILLGIDVVESALAAGCRTFVNTGTQSQHLAGTSDYAPTDLYAASKQAFQDLLAYYTAYRGLRAVTLKLSDVYGPGDPRRRLVDLLIAAQMSGAPIELTEGLQEIDLLHVDDAVAAFRRTGAALLAGSPLEPEYSIASGRRLTLRALAHLIEVVGAAPIDARWGRRPYAPGTLMVPWAGSARPPGWAPEIRLEDGLRELVDLARNRRTSE